MPGKQFVPIELSPGGTLFGGKWLRLIAAVTVHLDVGRLCGTSMFYVFARPLGVMVSRWTYLSNSRAWQTSWGMNYWPRHVLMNRRAGNNPTIKVYISVKSNDFIYRMYVFHLEIKGNF